MMAAGPGTVASATSCPLSDLFGGVWEDKIEPLLRDDAAGKLKAHCLRSNVAELRSHKVSWRIQP